MPANELKFDFKFNKGQAQQMRRTVKQMVGDIDAWEKSDKKLATATTQLSKQNQAFTNSTSKLRAAVVKVDTALKKEVASQAKIRKATKDTTKEIDRQTSSLRRANDEFDKVSRDVSLAGDVQSNVGAIRGLAGAGGFGGADKALGVAGEFAVLTEELPRLKTALAGMPQTLKAAATALGPLGLAVVAVGAAAAIAGAQILKQVQAQQEFIKSQLEGERGVREFIQSGATRDQAKERLDELKRLLDSEQAALSDLQNRREAGFANAQKQFGDFAARLGVLAGGQDGLNEQIETSAGLVNEYRGELDALTAALDEGKFAANDTAAADAEAAAQAEALAKAREQEVAAAERQIATLQEQAATALTEARRRRGQQSEDRGRARERLLEDQQEQDAKAQVAHNRRIESIKEAGLKKIEAIEQKLSDLPQERFEALFEAEAKTNKTIANENSDFMRSEIKAVQKFHDEQSRIDRKRNKDRIRLLQDLNSDLLDAEQGNDILRFVQIQKEGEKRIRREAEDASESDRERANQFADERATAREEHSLRLADLKSELDEERALIRARFADQREQLAQRAEEERQQLAQTLNAQRKAFQEASAAIEQARAKQQRRAEEDQRLADQRQRAALQRRIAGISQEVAALQLVAQSVDIITAKARNLASAANGSGASVLSSGPIEIKSGQTSFGGAGGALTAFAKGGIVNKPTLALLGDGGPEMIIPMRSSSGLGGAGGITVNVPIQNLNAGEIASPAEARQIASEIANGLANEVVGAIVTGMADARFKRAVA